MHNKNIHIGMPYSSGRTDGQNFSIAVKNTIDEVQLTHEVNSYAQDDRRNVLTCKRALNTAVNNSNFFEHSQPIFEQQCVSHILQGAC